MNNKTKMNISIITTIIGLFLVVSPLFWKITWMSVYIAVSGYILVIVSAIIYGISKPLEE